MRCLSHPKGSLINRRPENALDLERVFEVALEEGVALEVNGGARRDSRGPRGDDVALGARGRNSPFHYSPLKLAEYLAAGLPVIAPRAGELPEQLRDGVDAVLVSPGDVEELAAVLQRLQRDPDERAG